jgi:PPK2 family polyphosphate:nucleotide phosphotransferase
MAKKLIRLSDIPTTAPDDVKEKEIKAETESLVERLGDLQQRMYAEHKQSVMVILQGMDGSGKDGAVHDVFDACRITGLSLTAFKKPTEEEFAHDFLWRIHKVVPQKGTLAIFNRSHYEDILIQWVHNWIDDTRREQRMNAINAFETLLEQDNNTHIFKFYMHISYEEQEKQLRQRMEDPAKFWKHNPGDWEERKLWPRYMEAYEYAINESVLPWHICPVDNRWYRNYFIAKTMVNALDKLHMKMPPLPK